MTKSKQLLHLLLSSTPKVADTLYTLCTRMTSSSMDERLVEEKLLPGQELELQAHKAG